MKEIKTLVGSNWKLGPTKVLHYSSQLIISNDPTRGAPTNELVAEDYL